VFRIAVPKGWIQRDGQVASVRPAETPGAFSFIYMSLDAKCDGACEPKDWAEASGEIDFRVGRDETVIKNRLEQSWHLQ